MLNRLVEWTVRFNQCSFIKITRQTLMLLFPIAYVGTLAVMLKKAFFATDSFFFNVADLGDIMPDWLWTGITGLTGGLAATGHEKGRRRPPHGGEPASAFDGAAARRRLPFQPEHITSATTSVGSGAVGGLPETAVTWAEEEESPPHARGRVLPDDTNRSLMGITPAYAGKRVMKMRPPMV